MLNNHPYRQARLVPPPPRASRLVMLALMLFAVVNVGAHCPPPPPTDAGTPDVVTPAGWVDTARTIINVTSFALPAMRALVPVLHLDPQAEVIVLRALDAANAEALPAFRIALERYERLHEAGARCEVKAAAAGLTTALLGVADALAAAGWDVAPDLRIVLGGLGAIVDQLSDAPECHVDAGFASAHDDIGIRLNARPQPLRPFPALPSRTP